MTTISDLNFFQTMPKSASCRPRQGRVGPFSPSSFSIPNPESVKRFSTVVVPEMETGLTRRRAAKRGSLKSFLFTL